MLPFDSNVCLFVINRSPLYGLLLMHSTDDGRVGYPDDSHSYSEYSSDSVPSLPAGVEHERCRYPVVQWLSPPRTHNIEVQTNREVVLAKQEKGTGTVHAEAH